jgi:hypothetical protein
LSVTFTADGFVTHSFADDDFKDCRDHVKRVLGLTDDLPLPAFTPPPGAQYIDEAARIDEARRIWISASPIAGTLAETYLASRDLSYEGEALRYHPAYRAMIALMTDAVTGEPCGVHRTFLDRDGKKVDRKMKGRARGAVVRLYEWFGGDGLAIAEGIETALSAEFTPAWACLTAGGIDRFPVLPGVDALTIFADNDASGTGERVARNCAERWHAAGAEVTVHIPLEVNVDFATQKAA